jgi:hypothetical protein
VGEVFLSIPGVHFFSMGAFRISQSSYKTLRATHYECTGELNLLGFGYLDRRTRIEERDCSERRYCFPSALPKDMESR